MTILDQVYALLFVADSPSTTEQLTVALAATEGQVEQALEVLERELGEKGPIQLVRLAGGVQLSTKPEYADILGAFLKPQKQRISKSLLEVLSIIAYRQPITMPEIESLQAKDLRAELGTIDWKNGTGDTGVALPTLVLPYGAAKRIEVRNVFPKDVKLKR